VTVVSPELRSAIYTLAAAVMALAVAYKWVSEEQAALWVAVFAGAIATITAYLNRPTKG
jgi:hypothetical protein